MTSLAVIAHQGKSLDGGLEELERLLTARGFADATWFRITKSKEAPLAARKVLDDGVDLVLVWGGDGTAQRCIDVFAGSSVRVALLPAGTANLLANSLGIPGTLTGALDVALAGAQRRIDVGVLNGERFANIAGAGLDARMMKKADGRLKERLGKLAYVWTGVKATRVATPQAVVKVDGRRWHKGAVSCLLFGNMGSLGTGLTVLPSAQPDDGILEFWMVTASGLSQWARVAAWIVLGRSQRCRFVETSRGRSIEAKFDRAVPYELDGGARKRTRRLRVGIEPGAVLVSVPDTGSR